MLSNSFINLIIGDLDEKRIYRQMRKREKALPSDYRFVYRRIYNYMMNRGANADELLELFEQSAAENKHIFDIIGDDVGQFCDNFIDENSIFASKMRNNLNKEISDYFREDSYAKYK